MINNRDSKIFIIDDDHQVLRGLSLLLISAGYQVQSYTGISDLLAMEEFHGPGCILLDIFLEGPSGLDMQEEIIEKFCCHPIIYITGHADVPMSVRAMRKGAVNFLQKPIHDEELLKAVGEAVEISRIRVQERVENNRIRSLAASLTPRELEIYRLLITGMLNKQIAAELNISEHTVKIHRGKITGKLGVKSVAELVRLAQRLNLG